MTTYPEIKPRGVRLDQWRPLKGGDVLEVLCDSSSLYTDYGEELIVNADGSVGHSFNGLDLVCRLKKVSRKPKGISSFIKRVEEQYRKKKVYYYD